MSDEQTMQYIRRGLSPQLQAELITHNPTTLDETIERVYLADSAFKLKNSASVQHVQSSNQLSNITSAMHTLEQRMEELSRNQPQHVVLNQARRGNEQSFPQKQYQHNWNQTSRRPRMNGPRGGCFICGDAHMARDCIYRVPDNSHSVPNRPPNNNQQFGPRYGAPQQHRYAQPRSHNFTPMNPPQQRFTNWSAPPPPHQWPHSSFMNNYGPGKNYGGPRN